MDGNRWRWGGGAAARLEAAAVRSAPIPCSPRRRIGWARRFRGARSPCGALQQGLQAGSRQRRTHAGGRGPAPGGGRRGRAGRGAVGGVRTAHGCGCPQRARTSAGAATQGKLPALLQGAGRRKRGAYRKAAPRGGRRRGGRQSGERPRGRTSTAVRAQPGAMRGGICPSAHRQHKQL
jgi:hypothetical protein